MKNLRFIVAIIFALCMSFLPKNEVQAQCGFDNSYWGGYTLGGVGSSVQVGYYAGYYIGVNVVAGGTYTFTTCGLAGWDTQLSLYNSSLQAVAYNDDACGLQSNIVYTSNFTGTLYVLLDQYYCSNSFSFASVQVTVNSLPILCPDYSFTAPFNHAGSTSGDECNLRTGLDRTYRVTIPCAGNWTFSLCGSSFDTYIYVSTGCCGGSVLAQNDDFCGLSSEVTVNLAAGTYYVDVEPWSGGSGSYNLAVTGGSTTTANAGADVSICQGQGTTLNGSGTSVNSYSWSPTNGLSNPNIANPVASPTTTTTYTLTTTGNCGTATDQMVVTVTPSPTANAGSNATLCGGGSVQLNGTASNYTSVSWSPTIGLSNPNILNPTASPSSTTTYTLTASSGGGSGGVDQSSLTTNTYMAGFSQGDLAQSFIPAQNTMCGASVYLQPGVGSGTGDITISLYTNLPNLGGTLLRSGTATGVAPGGTATVSWSSVSVSPGTTYYMVYTSTNGSLGLTGNTTNPYPSGQVYANPGYGSFPGFDYTFQTFSCGGGGCTATSQVTVTVNNPPAVNAGANASICAGGSTVLNGSTNGSSYSWSPTVGLSNPNILNPVASPTTTTTYTLTASNSGGGSSIAYNEAFVSGVSPLTQATAWCTFRSQLLNSLTYSTLTIRGSANPLGITLSDPVAVANIAAALRTASNYSFTDLSGNVWAVSVGCVSGSSPCPGSPGVVLTVNASNCSCESPAPNVYVVRPEINNLNWGGITTGGCNSPSQTMEVLFGSSSGCSSSSQMTVTVNPLPTVSAGPDATVCAGQSTTLNGSGSGYSSLLWTPGTGLNNASILNPTATPSTTTNYTLTATSGAGCVASDAAMVTVTPLPNASFTGLNSTYCTTAGPATLTPATPGGTFSGSGVVGNTFDPTSVSVGTYNVTYTIPGSTGSYSYSAVPFSPRPTGGNFVSLSDDAMSSAVPIGFNFNFYGVNYSQFEISSNGFISFNLGTFQNGCCSGGLLPQPFGPTNIIAAAWEDLYPPGGGSVSYNTTGAPGSRVCVISWDIPHYSGSYGYFNVTTQIHLYEGSNIIQIHTSQMNSDGGLHTQGIQDNGGTQAVTTPGRNSTSWNAFNDGVQFAPGSSCGNSSTQSVSVIQCNLPPVAVCQNVTVSANGNCQGSATASQFNNGSSDPNGDPLTYAVSPAGPYALGNTSVLLTVSDGQLTATCNATVTVVDNTLPSISCPANVTVPASNGICGAAVSYASATATDNCAGVSVSLIGGSASGSTFPVGVTTNTFRAVDGSGNSATCSFTVTVTDNQVPVITCPANQTVCSVAGTSTAVVTYSAATATDNCPGVSVAQTGGLSSGAAFPLGANTVSYTATDASGNTAVCSFTITVNTFSGNSQVFAERIGNVTATTLIPTHEAANGFDNDGYTMTGTADVRNTLPSVGYGGASGGANVFFTGAGRTFEISGINTSTFSTMGMAFGIFKSTTASNGSDFLIQASTDGITYNTIFHSLLPTGTGTAVWSTMTAVGFPSAANLRIRFTNLGTTQYRIDDIILGGLTNTATITNVGNTSFCNGGSVTLVATQAAGYLWSTGETTQSITVATAGNYSVTVTAANGCTATAGPVAVTVFANPSVTASGVNATCPGYTNGSATALATGGTPSYSYLWTPGGQTGVTANNIGAGTYSVQVTDANGCTAASNAVTITDNDIVAPVALCQSVTVQLNAAGVGSTTAAAVNNGSTDNCTITGLSLNNSSFGCANVGSGNTVILTVTDIGGNTATCSAIVTVQDLIAPVALCQNVTVQLDNTGNGSTNAAAVNNGSTDACGIASTSLSPTAFTCANVNGTPATSLFISEYIEGSSNNKCIEIFNGTGAAVNLSGYSLRYYFNGSTSAGTVINLSGTVANGDVFVVCSSLAGGAFTSQADLLSASSFYNGNDAIELRNGTTAIDIIGRIGQDPGTAWTGGGLSTVDRTLVRNAGISAGNTANAIGFPSLVSEWTGFAVDNSANLGGHSFTGGNNVVLTVTDVNGNSSTCSASVTVQDNVAPVALCQSVTINLASSGSQTVAASSINNGSSDACGIASTTLNPNTFTCDDLGVNNVTLTVTDVNGNSSTCAATVTVTNDPLVATTSSPTFACGYNVTCNGATNGSATVATTGGCLGYTYLWSNGQTTATATGLGAGTHSVTVTDLNGTTTTRR